MNKPTIAVQNIELLGQLKAALGLDVQVFVHSMDEWAYLEYAAGALVVNSELLNDIAADMDTVPVSAQLKPAFEGVKAALLAMCKMSETVAVDLERICALQRGDTI